jgi:hypothetical protein
MLLKTINASADVTAILSARGVRKATARKNPAALKILHSDAAILNSRVKNCPCVRSFNVPRAKPRMTARKIG